MRDDAEFLQVAALYTGRADFDVARLVARLVEDESVPVLPVLRYKPSGLRKRAAWERTWALQRMEDAIDARVALPAADPDRLTPEAAATLKAAEVGAVPVPPRYASADFRKGGWWRLRGKLDVPKERFVSLPGCERDADPSLVVGWAGWNALEQSRAVAGYFSRMREQEGWTAERLAPLLAALLELLPWVRQYHNAPDPEFDIGMGDYFEAFIDDEARALSLTRESLGTGRRRTAGRGEAAAEEPRETAGQPCGDCRRAAARHNHDDGSRTAGRRRRTHRREHRRRGGAGEDHPVRFRRPGRDDVLERPGPACGQGQVSSEENGGPDLPQRCRNRVPRSTSWSPGRKISVGTRTLIGS